MLFSNVVFPLFTLSFAAPAVSAMHLNPAHAKRAAVAHRDIGSVKLARSEDAVIAGRNKEKRLVRKKKRSTCQAKFNATSSSIDSGTSSSVTASATATNAIGNIENWANGSASASSSNAEMTSTSSAFSAAQTAASTSGWYLVEEWVSAFIISHQPQLRIVPQSGSTFFDNWSFWDYSDPTHGTVDYVSASEAWNQGLISINSAGHAIMSVDTTEVVSGGRKSVRIHGNKM